MSDYKYFDFSNDDEIARVKFGKNNEKSMTTLNRDSLKEFDKLLSDLEKLKSEKKIKGVIFSSLVPDCFIAGMDISVISDLETPADAAQGAEEGQKLFNRIDDLGVPTIACVDGPCLGGGFELALACDFILASDSKKTTFALPEVKLGILPGFGGTYRLPRKIGLPKSLDVILTGKNIDSRKAKKIGIAKEVYAKEYLDKMAIILINNYKEEHSSLLGSLEKMASDNFLSRKVIFQKARESVLKSTKGFYQAPLKILDLLESGSFKSRDSYLALENRAFGELCLGSQSQNLQHIFHMVDQSKKRYKEKAHKKISQGAVLGAGTMGGGIAWLFAQNNQRPRMKDINKEGLELGLKQSASNFQGALKRRKMTPEDFERKQRSISAQLDYHGFERVDLVIEAIVENMDVKKKVFAELEDHVSSECLITSNTSSLSINEMSKACKDSSRFAGLHFFNPVHRMPLVEIIKHDNVSEETIQRLYEWALKVKKTPVVVGDGPGFLVNRILMPFITEAVYLLAEGISIEDIDKAVLNFGMPMGPCRLMDEIGLDVLVHVGEIMHAGLGERAKPHDLSRKIVENKLLGKKSGSGFYTYESGKESEVNEKMVKLLPKSKKGLSDIEIQMRVILPMINEAANVLQEKIVEKAQDVDLGLIFGIGFPPFRGGLLKYADTEGLQRILKAIERYAGEVDEQRYKPSDLLVKLVKDNKQFYDL